MMTNDAGLNIMANARETTDAIQHDRISPWAYIITLYFPVGLISFIMVTLPGAYFKLIGVSNELIGLLSGIGIILSFRFLISPWLDAVTTKRRLSIMIVIAAGVLCFLAAGVIYADFDQTAMLWCISVVLVAITVCSASQQVAANGYYIRVLDAKRQAEFIGIKAAAIRGGIVFSDLVLLLGATKIAASYGSVSVQSADQSGFRIGFAAAYLMAGVVLILVALYNKLAIPVIAQDQPVRHTRFAVGETLRDYFKQDKVLLMVLLILLYRVGESFLAVMKTPFFLDPFSAGGMNAAATTLPYYGLLTSLPWMIVGGILGGYIVKWFGLRKTFIPLGLFMSLPHLFYAWLAWDQPHETIQLLGETLNVGILVGNSLETLGYGLAFSPMFYYMHIMATEAGRNKTSILAISFALMDAGWVLPGMASGYIQAYLGYTGLFVFSSFVGLIALALIPFLPMPSIEKAQAKAPQRGSKPSAKTHEAA